MEKDSRISGGQLIAILLASRLAVSLTSLPTLHQTSHATDFMISTLLQIPLLLLLYLPVWWFARRTHGAGTVDYACILFGRGGLVVAGLYALVSLYIQMIALMRFDHFVSSALNPDMSRIALCAALVVAAFLAALHGLQAVGRTAVLIIAGVAAMVVFVFLSLLPQMDPLCFAPPLYDGLSPVIAGTLEELPRTLEVVSIGLLLPYVKGNMTRHYFTWTVLAAVGVIVIQATSAGVLGDYGEMVLFPYYTAVTTAQIGVLQRVDILAAALWLTALFVKMAFFAMQYMSCVQRIGGERFKLLYALGGGLLVLIPGLLLGNSPLLEERAAIWGISVGIIAVMAVLLPLVLIAADAVRNKRLKEARKG